MMPVMTLEPRVVMAMATRCHPKASFCRSWPNQSKSKSCPFPGFAKPHKSATRRLPTICSYTVHTKILHLMLILILIHSIRLMFAIQIPWLLESPPKDNAVVPCYWNTDIMMNLCLYLSLLPLCMYFLVLLKPHKAEASHNWNSRE